MNRPLGLRSLLAALRGERIRIGPAEVLRLRQVFLAQPRLPADADADAEGQTPADDERERRDGVPYKLWAEQGWITLTPGPAVLYVFSQGMRYGPGPAVAGNLGVVTGNLIYFFLSALGLGAVILASGELFLVIKWAGAAYLIWLGINAIRGAGKPLDSLAASMGSILLSEGYDAIKRTCLTFIIVGVVGLNMRE